MDHLTALVGDICPIRTWLPPHVDWEAACKSSNTSRLNFDGGVATLSEQGPELPFCHGAATYVARADK